MTEGNGTTGWARMTFRFADAGAAEAACAALAPENGPHCEATVEGDYLMVRVPEARIGSFAATVDDLLACLGAIERTEAATDRSA